MQIQTVNWGTSRNEHLLIVWSFQIFMFFSQNACFWSELQLFETFEDYDKLAITLYIFALTPRWHNLRLLSATKKRIIDRYANTIIRRLSVFLLFFHSHSILSARTQFPIRWLRFIRVRPRASSFHKTVALVIDHLFKTWAIIRDAPIPTLGLELKLVHPYNHMKSWLIRNRDMLLSVNKNCSLNRLFFLWHKYRHLLKRR